MASNQYHPVTAQHYVNVIRDDTPVFSELRLSFQRLSQIRPWQSVISLNQFNKIALSLLSPLYQDQRTVYVLWHDTSSVSIMPKRKSKLVLHYSESIGNPHTFSDLQKEKYQGLMDRRLCYDLIFAHTPQACAYLKPYTPRARWAPVGYDPVLLPMSPLSQSRLKQVAYYGANTGKKQWAVPALRHELGPLFKDITRMYGMARQQELSKLETSLYIPQSNAASFSTMRLWHSVLSGAVLIAEPTDTFPAIPGEHYLQVPELTPASVSQFSNCIKQLLQQDLRPMADKAYADLSKYTTDYCFDTFIVEECGRL